ncbi:hypothetical protein F4782DRAFT_119924 [Xylaria castorea]|nr:hypothetical protein F4782DRAFT_119924 [Xylaria castorea]
MKLLSIWYISTYVGRLVVGSQVQWEVVLLLIRGTYLRFILYLLLGLLYLPSTHSKVERQNFSEFCGASHQSIQCLLSQHWQQCTSPPSALTDAGSAESLSQKQQAPSPSLPLPLTPHCSHTHSRTHARPHHRFAPSLPHKLESPSLVSHTITRPLAHSEKVSSPGRPPYKFPSLLCSHTISHPNRLPYKHRTHSTSPHIHVHTYTYALRPRIQIVSTSPCMAIHCKHQVTSATSHPTLDRRNQYFILHTILEVVALIITVSFLSY